jgi:hypothetical protein
VWLLGTLLAALVLVTALAGVGILVGVRQPGQLWAVPVGQGYFAIGRIVSKECLRRRAQGVPVVCAEGYGAVLYLARARPGGSGVEHLLFLIPDAHT